MTISRIYVTRLIGRAVTIRSSDWLACYAMCYSKDDQNVPIYASVGTTEGFEKYATNIWLWYIFVNISIKEIQNVDLIELREF